MAEFATVDAVFERLAEGVRTQPDMAKQVNGVVEYVIGDRVWTLELKPGSGKVVEGRTGSKPDVTITLGPDDFLAIASGKTNPQQAFMRGKLKFKGNLAMAMKLNSLLEAARKAGLAAPSGGGAPAPATPAPAAAGGAGAAGGVTIRSKPLFDAIAVAVKEDGAALVKKVGGVIAFHVLAKAGDAKPAAVVTLELKSGSGAVSMATSPPATPSPDLTLTITDDDFVAMSDGKLNAQTAFIKGKLKVKGNMALAMKLQTVLEAARKAPTAKL